jgi:hypothetical protein
MVFKADVSVPADLGTIGTTDSAEKPIPADIDEKLEKVVAENEDSRISSATQQITITSPNGQS